MIVAHVFVCIYFPDWKVGSCWMEASQLYIHHTYFPSTQNNTLVLAG